MVCRDGRSETRLDEDGAAEMKNCIGCKHAEWSKTASGRLHPGGGGLCRYEVKPVVLPASMYFIGGQPNPSGGYINRKEEFKDHCKTYEREQK